MADHSQQRISVERKGIGLNYFSTETMECNKSSELKHSKSNLVNVSEESKVLDDMDWK